ncbi:unnamed protein product [Ceutorhynchus assimilis]|uniref:DUF4780 domain-containing protein n=1 Tax=Ceutorhynchus assimilis TaxID=467358 RepID=A0A9N9QLR7_9CUCU|nr:unnamed protein product [Ceutorhynchus assimilis]
MSTGSEALAKTPTSKCHRSDRSTLNAQSQKKAKTDRGKVAFNNVLTAVKIAIVSQDLPETRLSEEQFDQLQMALLDAIQAEPQGSGPASNGCYLENGAAVLSCRGRQSYGSLGTRRHPTTQIMAGCIAESKNSQRPTEHEEGVGDRAGTKSTEPQITKANTM